jgi:hypothetical protein
MTRAKEIVEIIFPRDELKEASELYKSLSEELHRSNEV